MFFKQIKVSGLEYFIDTSWGETILFHAFYKKLETRYRKQEGEAPGAPILARIVGVFSFIVRCGLAAHVGYMKVLIICLIVWIDYFHVLLWDKFRR